MPSLSEATFTFWRDVAFQRLADWPPVKLWALTEFLWRVSPTALSEQLQEVEAGVGRNVI